MFDIGWSEFLVIGVVALIAIGPKELPAVLRTMGQYMGKIRRMAADFQGQFHEAMREAEMADLKKEVDALTSQAQSLVNYDPLSPATETPKAETAAETALSDATPTSAETPPPAAPDPSAARPPVHDAAAAPVDVPAPPPATDLHIPPPEPPPPPTEADFIPPPSAPAKPGGDRAA